MPQLNSAFFSLVDLDAVMWAENPCNYSYLGTQIIREPASPHCCPWGLLGLGTTDIWGQVILCGAVLCMWGVQQHHWLYLLDPRSSSPLVW